MLYHAKAIIRLCSLPALSFALDQAGFVALSFNVHLQQILAQTTMMEVAVLVSACSVGAASKYK